MMHRYRALTTCVTIFYLIVFHGANSADLDTELTKACRQLCSEEDHERCTSRMGLEFLASPAVLR